MSDPRPPVFVNSFGGVGSKTFVRAATGLDGIRALAGAHGHHRAPPTWLAGGTRVVYLHGDPRNAVVSFFGRRTGRHERHGFDGKAGNPSPDWPLRHCRNLGGDWQALSADWDLGRFLDHGRDLFRLEEHYRNWREGPLPWPVLFVRFEEHRDHLPAILDFLGLPRAAAGRFPPVVPRSSDWTQRSAAERDGLERLYGPLAARLAAEPPVLLRPAGGAVST